MGLLDRVNQAVAETRTIGGTPWQPWTSPLWRWDTGGPTHPSRSGVLGTDGALRLAPVYACVRVLADGVAKLPLQQYRDLGTRKVKIPAGQLLSKPSAYGNLYDWLFIGMTSLALHGNAYGLITARDGYGYPTSIEWLPPGNVEVIDAEPWNPAQTKFFYFGRQVPRDDLLHIRAFALPGRTEAVSPLRSFQMLIESGQDALEYGTTFYRGGGFPIGTFQNSQYEVDDEQSDTIRAKLTRSLRNRQPLVYGRDWDYKPISVPPNEAQFVEAMQLNATQIASVYGVQPRKAGGIHGDSQTYSNVEMDQLVEVTDTLDPWLIRFETALADCVPTSQYVSFNRDARIRHDLQARYNAYRTARDIGLLNVDEIRDLEEREPLPRPTDPTDYDGRDFTPLQIQVAAARGLKEELGVGASGVETNPQQSKTPGPVGPGGVLGQFQPKPPAPAAPANGNGKRA